MSFRINKLQALTTSLCLLLLARAAHATIDGAAESYEAARVEAAAAGKPMLIDFYTSWCGPCKRFYADAGTDASIQGVLEKVVFVTVDAERGEGIELAETYGVKSYPNYVLANAEGVVLHRWVGYEEPGDFVENLSVGLADPTTHEEKRLRYEETPTLADAVLLGEHAFGSSEYGAAVKYYQAAAKMDSDREYKYELFENKCLGARYDEFTLADATDAADAVLASDASTDLELISVHNRMSWLATRTNQPGIERPYLKAAYEAAIRNPEFARTADRLAIEYTFYVEQEPEKAIELKWASMPEGWQESPDQLNSYAWWAFEHHADLQRAEMLAAKGAELAEDGQARAQILDTQAEICNAIGNCDEAIAIMERAIEADPESSYYRKQLERFRKIAAEAG